jgi:hypothetical protein
MSRRDIRTKIKRIPLGKDRKVHKQHHWKWGEDPNDPDTSDPRWEFTTYEKLAPKPEPVLPEEEPTGGPDSKVTCYRCKHNTYRIVKQQPVIYKSGWGATYTEEKDAKLMLVCPTCRDRIQIYESYLQRIRGRKHAE